MSPDDCRIISLLFRVAGIENASSNRLSLDAKKKNNFWHLKIKLSK